jgi:hypothetical protein
MNEFTEAAVRDALTTWPDTIAVAGEWAALQDRDRAEVDFAMQLRSDFSAEYEAGWSGTEDLIEECIRLAFLRVNWRRVARRLMAIADKKRCGVELSLVTFSRN